MVSGGIRGVQGMSRPAPIRTAVAHRCFEFCGLSTIDRSGLHRRQWMFCACNCIRAAARHSVAPGRPRSGVGRTATSARRGRRMFYRRLFGARLPSAQSGL